MVTTGFSMGITILVGEKIGKQEFMANSQEIYNLKNNAYFSSDIFSYDK